MKTRWMWLLAGLFLASCAPQVKLTVLRPAEIETGGITKVAVGPFEVVELSEALETERNGEWTARPLEFGPAEKAALAKQIRAQVIAQLAETPYFELVYTDEFEKLATGAKLEETISAAGYKEKEAQAVIAGRVFVSLTKTDGATPKKVELEFVSGGKRSFDVSVEKIVWWPYKSMRGNLTLELKLIRLVPTEVLSVSTQTRTFAQKIGGAPLDLMDQVKKMAQDFQAGAGDAEEERFSLIEGSSEVLPSFEQTLSSLSGSIATDFVRKIAVTETKVALPLASGGDQRGKFLVQAGAYQMAIRHLQQVTAQDPKPDDLYNLALAFEATGGYGLAQGIYKEALAQAPESSLYAMGLGRIERILREKPSLKRQLNTKGAK